MNDDFVKNFEQVLKYSTDNVDNLIAQLSSAAHNATRWGHPEGDKTFRWVLADALQERDREHEADLLRSGKHILIKGGQSCWRRVHNRTHRSSSRQSMELHC